MHLMIEVALDVLTQGIHVVSALLLIVLEASQYAGTGFAIWMGWSLPRNRFSRAWINLWMSQIMKKERARYIHNMVYFRIPGHVFFFSLYMYHSTVSQGLLRDLMPEQPELVELNGIIGRFFTVWNMHLQIIYIFISLTCDITTALNKGFIIPDWFRYYRFTIFAGLVWPMAWIVSVFWPFYLYRNELMIFPSLRLIMSPACNFVMHGVVQIYVLWELFLLPKEYFMRTIFPFHHLIVFLSIYNTVLLYTRYISPGIWPYPMLNMVDGTIFPFIIIAGFEFVGILAYFIQIHLRNTVWQKLNLIKSK